MTELTCAPVADDASIAAVIYLAGIIWREHYTPIIGAEQVEYMLEHFQSENAVREQIGEGYLYYLIRNDTGEAVGYFSAIPRKEGLFLSKIYVLREHRGKGYARQSMEFIQALAKSRNLQRITLTVNKRNRGSIHAYQKMGFAVYDAVVHDIGSGFVMDDYAMEKHLT
jgi:diamine N-acetyltransferase